MDHTKPGTVAHASSQTGEAEREEEPKLEGSLDLRARPQTTTRNVQTEVENSAPTAGPSLKDPLV